MVPDVILTSPSSRSPRSHQTVMSGRWRWRFLGKVVKFWRPAENKKITTFNHFLQKVLFPHFLRQWHETEKCLQKCNLNTTQTKSESVDTISLFYCAIHHDSISRKWSQWLAELHQLSRLRLFQDIIILIPKFNWLY